MKPTSVKLPLSRACAGLLCASCEQPVGHAIAKVQEWEELGSPSFINAPLSAAGLRCVLCGADLELVEPPQPDPPGEAS